MNQERVLGSDSLSTVNLFTCNSLFLKNIRDLVYNGRIVANEKEFGQPESIVSGNTWLQLRDDSNERQNETLLVSI
jgi:hypothetical protein